MKQKLLKGMGKAIPMLILTMLLGFAAFAQKTVTGKVSGPDGAPIVGATVAVKGSNVATTTGSDGTFSIVAPSATSTLVISYVGYEVIERSAGASDFNIGLKAATNNLNEVVVTGYTSQAKKSITGAVAIVKAEELKAIPAGNAENQLQGRAAGVTVVSSNQPGDGASVRIRGFSSFQSNEPLYIIDGVPTNNLASLNPNDIESMQVLKDAAAASIYGSRASSGVIVVTTKRGSGGSAKVSYDMYYGLQQPGKNYDMANPNEMAKLVWMAKTNSGKPLEHPQYGKGAEPILPDLILPGGKKWGEVDTSKYFLDTDNPGASNQIMAANKNGTNWYDEITRVAPITNHNLAVSGSSGKSRYMFSFNYFDQDGILIHNFFKRYTARINTVFNIKNNIRIGENLSIYVSEDNRQDNNSEGTSFGMAYRLDPMIPVYDIRGNWGGTRAPQLGNATNPVADRTRSRDDRGNNLGLFGNMFLEVDFLRHFTARTSFGGNYNDYNYRFYTYRTYERSENNSGNAYGEGFGTGRTWTWTNTLNYKNTFAEKHDVNVLLGTEAIEEKGRDINANGNNYYTDAVGFRSLNTRGAPAGYGGSPRQERALYSLFGKVDYAYDGKYLFSATVRRDGSSVFGASNRYGVFPAFSVGWRVTSEKFMNDVSWLTDLKLRASYGEMGNQRAVPATNQFSTYASVNTYYAPGGTTATPGIISNFVGNPNGKWETKKSTNIGFDALLFKGNTEISFDWYNDKTTDLLFPLRQSALGGGAVNSNPAYYNVASMKNTGIDLMISQRAKIGSVLLRGSLAFTTYKNQITGIAEGISFFEAGSVGRINTPLVRNAVGVPISSYYGYKVLGFFADATDVSKSPTQDGAAPGRFKYADLNGRDANGQLTGAPDGKIDNDDRTFLGSPNPEFTYGINLSAEWKGFDVAAFFYGVQGREAANWRRWWTDYYGTFLGGKSKDALYDSWLPTRQNAKLPIQEEASNFSNGDVFTSDLVEDASYLRLKNLTIGYTFSSNLTSKIKIDRVRIYVQAVNLFTLTKYSGLDPEIIGGDSAFGIDAGVYPTTKQFLFGLNVNF